MITLLRGGTEVADPRLGRLIEFDEASKAYSIAPVLAAIDATKPKSKTWYVRERLDQGKEGACVGFGWSLELAARPFAVPGITNQYAIEKVYWPSQRDDPFAGGAYPGATPVMHGTTVLAGAKVLKAAGLLPEYRWSFGMQDLVLSIGHAGPAVIGVRWMEGMFTPDAKGYIHPTGQVQGGHCCCIIGIKVFLTADGALDPVRSYFIIQNSWGADWGKNGRCRITVAEMGVLFEDGEFCIPVTRTLALAA